MIGTVRITFVVVTIVAIGGTLALSVYFMRNNMANFWLDGVTPVRYLYLRNTEYCTTDTESKVSYLLGLLHYHIHGHSGLCS
jgi:hypothetical protein